MKIECVNCLSKDVVALFTNKDVISKEIYIYFSCNNCNIVFIFPFPTHKRLTEIYSFKTSTLERAVNPILLFLWSNHLLRKVFDNRAAALNRSRAEFIDSFANSPKGLLLDIGCGSGGFLYEAQKRGWKTIGQDVSKKCVDITKKLLSPGAVVMQKDIRTYNFPTSVTVVTLWHVFEHLLDFSQTLSHVAKRTKKGSILIIESPNANALSLKVFKTFSPMLITPEHVTFWSNKGLRLQLKKNKFKVVSVSYPRTFLFTSITASYNFFFYIGKSTYVALFFAVLFSPISILTYFLFPTYNESIRVVAKRI